MYAAVCSGGVLKAMIVYAPEAMPAPPAPAMARPTMRVVEFLATAVTYQQELFVVGGAGGGGVTYRRSDSRPRR